MLGSGIDTIVNDVPLAFVRPKKVQCIGIACGVPAHLDDSDGRGDQGHDRQGAGEILGRVVDDHGERRGLIERRAAGLDPVVALRERAD